MSKLKSFFENRQKAIMENLSEDHKKIVKSWIYDDAGADLESFFPEDNRPAEEELEALQEAIDLSKEVESLEYKEKCYLEVKTCLEVLSSHTKR